MSINGITSTTSLWRIDMQNGSGSSGCSGPPGASGGDDSASISQQGFAALLADQQDGPPQLTDDQAAQIGTRIQDKDPSLFAKLDSDGDGTLSASELTAGKDALKDARAAEIGTNIQQRDPGLFKALDTDGDGTLSASELKAGKDLLQGGATEAVGAPGAPGASSAGGAGQGGGVHHHHHHGGGGGQTQSQSDPLSELFAALNGDGSGTDASASGTTGQTSSLTDLQYNSLQDALQSLFATSSTASS